MRHALLKSNKINRQSHKKEYRHIQKNIMEYGDKPIGQQFLMFRGNTASSFVESKGLR